MRTSPTNILQHAELSRDIDSVLPEIVIASALLDIEDEAVVVEPASITVRVVSDVDDDVMGIAVVAVVAVVFVPVADVVIVVIACVVVDFRTSGAVLVLVRGVPWVVGGKVIDVIVVGVFIGVVVDAFVVVDVVIRVEEAIVDGVETARVDGYSNAIWTTVFTPGVQRRARALTTAW